MASWINPAFFSSENRTSILQQNEDRVASMINLMKMGVHNINARIAFRSAKSLGKRVRVTGQVSIKNYGILEIGERNQFMGTIVPISIYISPEATLRIGERGYYNYGISIAANSDISIGSNCFFGTYVSITDNAFHEVSPERRLEVPESKPVVIGNNVWIANRVIILPGVTIGAGAAIGAGSVVTKDIPPRTLAVGVPAEVIREL